MEGYISSIQSQLKFLERYNQEKNHCSSCNYKSKIQSGVSGRSAKYQPRISLPLPLTPASKAVPPSTNPGCIPLHGRKPPPNRSLTGLLPPVLHTLSEGVLLQARQNQR